MVANVVAGIPVHALQSIGVSPYRKGCWLKTPNHWYQIVYVEHVHLMVIYQKASHLSACHSAHAA